MTFTVTFDANNGALNEDATSITNVGAITKSSSGVEYPLTLEYLNGSSLSGGLVSLSNDGYVALTSKLANISTIVIAGSGVGTLSYGDTLSFDNADNFVIGTHYAEGANYFEVTANGNLQISSITVTYGCVLRSYETFSVLGAGDTKSITNHGFTDSRQPIDEFFNGKLFLSTTSFNASYSTAKYNITSTSMNILKYSSDKTSVERISPIKFNIDFYFAKLYLEFDVSSFNEGDLLVLHKGSNFTAKINGSDHYFMMDTDFECVYTHLHNRLVEERDNFTYSIDYFSYNNENAVFDGDTTLEGFDTNKRWTNYSSNNQERDTKWTFNFINSVSVKAINLYHFIDGNISRMPHPTNNV